MKFPKFLSIERLLTIIAIINCLGARVYVPNIKSKSIEDDLMTKFSDNLNNDLLSNTLSTGINDSNKTYRQAGLSLQNRIINRDEIDREGRKLVEEYDKALEQTREIQQVAKKQGNTQETGNWGQKEPQERRLLQMTPSPVSTPTQMQPVMMAQPQYIYNPMTPAPTMYQMPVTPMMQQRVPVAQAVSTPTVEKKEEKEVEKKVETKEEKPDVKEDKKKSVKTNTTKKVIKTEGFKWWKHKNRKLFWNRRRRRHHHRRRHHRRRHHRRHHHRRRHNHHLEHRKNMHQLFYGHRYLHNPHHVRSPHFHKHNKAYYRNRYHHIYNPHYYYYLKVRRPKNMNYMKTTVTSKLQKAKIAMMNREKFDKEHEKRIKSAAELWNRTFIYDSVLLIERQLYEGHQKQVKQRMQQAAKLEAKATADIQEFYNKYFEKDPSEIKKEDLVHHIFL